MATILGHLALDKAEGRKGPEGQAFPNIVQGWKWSEAQPWEGLGQLDFSPEAGATLNFQGAAGTQ